MKAALVILAYLVLGVLETVPLIKEKNKKKIAVYLALWTAAMVFSVLLVLDVKLPSIERYIMDVIASLTDGGGI